MNSKTQPILSMCLGLAMLSIFVPATRAQTEPAQKNEAQQILELQSQLSERYRLLEEKLFTLHQYEQDRNPVRSKLLERAYVQSQEQMTALNLQQVVEMLSREQLRPAEDKQKAILKQLETLLQLLESEDRGKRVRDDIRRHQEYLKEVERLLRIQKSIRAQAEGNGDQNRLANSESRAAERTDRLAREIQRNESGTQDISSQTPGEEPGQPGSANPGSQQNQPQNSGDSQDPKPDDDRQAPPADKDAPATPNKDENPESQKNTAEDSNGSEGGLKGESGDSNGSGKNQPGSSPSDQSGQPGTPSDSAPGDDSPQNNVQKRLQAAEKKMRDAQQKLEQAQRSESIEDMKAAEREIAQAKKELEEILRQLREEEIERVLAMLEGRFRKMLEREVRVYESTRKLDQIEPAQRGTDFEINAGKLGVEQNAIATEASRALMLLTEDGSSVAFPETVGQMRQDMNQVAQRLAAARIGSITLEIEEDIIETLDYLIEALVKTQQDLEAMKRQGKTKSAQGMPGDRPLVSSLAEIKMMRGLQERIYRRHDRYSRLLDNPDDPVGKTDNPDLREALERLSERQRQLTEIARAIVAGLTQ